MDDFGWPQAVASWILGIALAATLLWVVGRICLRYPQARLAMLLVPIGLGAWIAMGGLTAPHGYAATYAFGAAWGLSLATAVAGCGLLLVPRTRKAGAIGLVAAAVILSTFYAVYFAGDWLGLNRWKNARQVEIPAVPPR